jgi:ferredoxin
MAIKVWIDQDLCTGDGLCEEIQPAIFRGHDDGLYYVKEVSWPDLWEGDGSRDPHYKMAEGQADVPHELLESTIEAAEECPGECIFIEMTDD